MSLQNKGIHNLVVLGFPFGRLGEFWPFWCNLKPTNNHKVYYTKKNGAPPKGLGCVSKVSIGFL
jgi:hypothetical protein